MAKSKVKLKSGDFLLTALVTGLVVFGVIMVFSSSYYNAIDSKGDAYHYLKRDSMWALAGFIIMFTAALVDYRFYRKFAKPILAISFILLIMVIAGLGSSANGATRWLVLGPVSLMPGEWAKPAAIIFTAFFLSEKQDRIRDLTGGLIPMIGLMAVYFALIILQPNTSTAIIVCCIIAGMMFIAGLNLFYVAGILGAGVAGLTFMILSDPEGYRMKRFLSFTDPFADPLGTGYQVSQSLMALGSGGLFGVGLGKSIQKTLYLPEPQNDFILAIIGEELGFIGILILLCAYLLLIWRGIHIALNAPDMFGMLLATGITIMLALQVIMNVAVVTSSMPPTGVTLPFISWGGNALLVFMGCMGILLNISRHSAK